MTISIHLNPDAETKLRQRAAALGKDISEVAREAVEEKLAIPETFSEILKPIHDAATKTGKPVDPDELDSVVDACRDEAFDRNHRRPTE